MPDQATARLAPGDPVKWITGFDRALAVDGGQNLAIVFDAFRELHFLLRFSRFFCQDGVRNAAFLIFLRKTGALGRT